MSIFGNHKHSFEADITILPLGPLTRRTYPFNGIRWDFCYADDVDERGLAPHVFMIWPEFMDEHNVQIPKDVSLQGRLRSFMHIVSPELVELHRKRLKVGSRFFCTEGSRLVAEGVVVSMSPIK